ncbi:MAG: hypothetical protein AB1847_10645 [bacterium]
MRGGTDAVHWSMVDVDTGYEIRGAIHMDQAEPLFFCFARVWNGADVTGPASATQ